MTFDFTNDFNASSTNISYSVMNFIRRIFETQQYLAYSICLPHIASSKMDQVKYCIFDISTSYLFDSLVIDRNQMKQHCGKLTIDASNPCMEIK